MGNRGSKKVEKSRQSQPAETKVKILPLGARDAGKSTLVLAFRLHGNNLNDPNSLKRLQSKIKWGINRLRWVASQHEVFLGADPVLSELLEFIFWWDDKSDWDEDAWEEISFAVDAFWKLPEVQALAAIPESRIHSCLKYLFDRVTDYMNPGYTTTTADLLASSHTTFQTQDHYICMGSRIILMNDVSGFRSGRRRWIQSFEDVTATVFCVNASEYQLQLQEDETTNRMHESLQLFKSLANSRHFTKTLLILLFTHTDEFQEALNLTPLAHVFPEYTGGNDVEAAFEFLTDSFKQLTTRVVFPMRANLTDPEDSLRACQEIQELVDHFVHHEFQETLL